MSIDNEINEVLRLAGCQLNEQEYRKNDIDKDKLEILHNILNEREFGLFYDYYYNNLSLKELREKYNIKYPAQSVAYIRDKIEEYQSEDYMDNLDKAEEIDYVDNSYKEYYDDKDLKRKISAVLSTLSPRQEKVIRLRFGIGLDREYTREEIASMFKVSKSRIEQIEKRAIKELLHPSRTRRFRSYFKDE